MAGWVYIVTNEARGALYVGVTNSLGRRVWEHREEVYGGFTKRYGLHRLVWYEEFSTMPEAIHREKRLKKWPRQWKIDLVEGFNPAWKDLYETLNA
jgi:putative endonuclease